MKKIIMLSAVIVAISFMAGGALYSESFEEKADRMSGSSSSVFAPGYLNAAKYRAEAVINQKPKEKNLLARMLDYVQNKMGTKINDSIVDKPKPVLQQKSSGPKKNSTISQGTRILSYGAEIVNSAQYNVSIGNGTDKVYEGSRLISEVFNGVRHTYVGFSDIGKATVQDGIAAADQSGGGIVVIRGWKEGDAGYREYEGFTIDNAQSSIKVYGGYGEDGIRDIQGTATTINGMVLLQNSDKAIEVNGLTMNGWGASYGVYVNNCSDLKVINNNIINSYQGLYMWNSSGDIFNNNLSAQLFAFAVYGNLNLNVTGNTIDHTAQAVGFGSGTVYFKNNDFNVNGVNGFFDLMTSGLQIISDHNNYNGSYAVNGYVTSVGDYFESQGGLKNTFDNQQNDYKMLTVTVTRDNIGTAVPLANEVQPLTYRSPNEYDLSSQYLLNPGSAVGAPVENNAAPVLRSLLTGKDALPAEIAMTGSPALYKTTKGVFDLSALAVPGGSIELDNVKLAGVLATIVHNPTEDQKTIIGVIKALLSDTKMTGKETDPDLVKAQNDLLQAAANALIAQAMPDLLKKGEVSNIKAIFQELDGAKARIMLEYVKSTKPYYENIIKDLAKNMTILQARHILNPNMTKDELDKLSPSTLDKILEKVKSMKNRTFEEEYLIQQEAKYRKAYLDPGRQKLADDLKGMLEGFTGRINDTLKNSDKK